MSNHATVRGRNTYQPSWWAKPPYVRRKLAQVLGLHSGTARYIGSHHPVLRAPLVSRAGFPEYDYPMSAAGSPRILSQRQPLKRLTERIKQRKRVFGRGYMRDWRKDVGGPPRIL